MKVVLFCHSLVSDWNHGNAHFLRGVVAELLERGHEVRVFEPADGWSRRQPPRRAGAGAGRGVPRAFPQLSSTLYELGDAGSRRGPGRGRPRARPRVERPRAGAPHRCAPAARRLPAALSRHPPPRGHRAARRWRGSICAHYDGVLAFGERDPRPLPRARWARRAWTWHEAADTRIFHPRPDAPPEAIWSGSATGATASAPRSCASSCSNRRGGCGCGARSRRALSAARAAADPPPACATAAGWPTTGAPDVFARHRLTVHVPRRPYVAGAARHPDDPGVRSAGLRHPADLRSVGGRRRALHARRGLPRRPRRRGDGDASAALLSDRELADALRRHGLATIRARHTCAHRVDELLAIDAELRPTRRGKPVTATSPVTRSR